MTTTQYASYEETAIVKTYTYTATVVTEQGESTTTLTARADLDCPRRREVKCPGNCGCWHQLHWNVNLEAYEPVHCTGCVLGLYDIHFVPAVVATPEPVAEVAAEPEVVTVEQISAGIEHYKQVCAAWDDEFDQPYVAPNEELSQETLALCAADTTVLNLDEPLALDMPPFWMQSENACEAKSTIEASAEVEPMDEQDALIAELAFEADAQPDRERYFAARSGKYVLLHLRESGMAVGCSCPSRVKKLRFQGKACKHMTAHNDMLKSATQQQEAA